MSSLGYGVESENISTPDSDLIWTFEDSSMYGEPISDENLISHGMLEDAFPDSAVNKHYEETLKLYQAGLETGVLLALSPFLESAIEYQLDANLEDEGEIVLNEVNSSFGAELGIARKTNVINEREYELIEDLRNSRNKLVHRGAENYHPETSIPVEESIDEALRLYESYIGVPLDRSMVHLDQDSGIGEVHESMARIETIEAAIDQEAYKIGTVMMADTFEEFLNRKLTDFGTGVYEDHGSPSIVRESSFHETLGWGKILTGAEESHTDVTPENIELAQLENNFLMTKRARDKLIHEIESFGPQTNLGLNFDKVYGHFEILKGEMEPAENDYWEGARDKLPENPTSTHSDMVPEK